MSTLTTAPVNADLAPRGRVAPSPAVVILGAVSAVIGILFLLTGPPEHPHASPIIQPLGASLVALAIVTVSLSAYGARVQRRSPRTGTLIRIAAGVLAAVPYAFVVYAVR